MTNPQLNILIPDLIAPPGDVEQSIFGPNAKIQTPLAMSNADVSADLWRTCHAILAYDKIKYNEEVMDGLDNCKVIVRAGIGVDNIDLEKAKQKGIAVCNVPDYCMSEVADHTMAYLLALVRGLPEHALQIPQGIWARSSRMSFRLDGKTFGIIGWGRIGQSTARRAQAFGLNIVFYDPWLKQRQDDRIDAKQVRTLKELGEQADIVSIHTPLTEETFRMINKDFFNTAKDNLILLNSARGPVIDLNDLRTAMQSGKVLGCGLDALPTEFTEDSRQLFTEYETQEEWLKGRLIITPHTAYYSHEAIIELRSKSAREAKRVLDGQKPLNCVNGFFD